MSSRTVSPSLHPCPASGGATGFLLASALWLHEALRPPGAEDARCVQPTSATRTICVHPHLARSRLAPRFSPRGRPTESQAPYGMTGGSDVFTTSEPLRRIVIEHAMPRAFCLAASSHERGRFLPTAPDTIEPLTPLSPLPLSPRAPRAFARAAEQPPFGHLLGLEGEGAAKAMIHAAS